MVCGEGGVQSAGRCVLGTLDMLGSKFLSILILMGTRLTVVGAGTTKDNVILVCYL